MTARVQPTEAPGGALQQKPEARDRSLAPQHLVSTVGMARPAWVLLHQIRILAWPWLCPEHVVGVYLPHPKGLPSSATADAKARTVCGLIKIRSFGARKNWSLWQLSLLQMPQKIEAGWPSGELPGR